MTKIKIFSRKFAISKKFKAPIGDRRCRDRRCHRFCAMCDNNDQKIFACVYGTNFFGML